jgi:hypothetical protein
MSEVFTIIIFVAFMTLFLVLAYGSGALDAHLRGYRIYVEDLDRQLMASDARSELSDPDELLHTRRGSGSKQTQFLYGCQGARKQRRHSTMGLD